MFFNSYQNLVDFRMIKNKKNTNTFNPISTDFEMLQIITIKRLSKQEDLTITKR